MDYKETMNHVLVNLFRDITTIEEKAMRAGEFKELSVNDMHVIDAIKNSESKNMTAIAKVLSVTTGTLTIAINGLVKKGYVARQRSEEDRRVVNVSLTDKGEKAYNHHAAFHNSMIAAVTEELGENDLIVLGKALGNLNQFFSSIVETRRFERFAKSEGPESK